MTEAPKRDPLTIVLQLLTLGVFAWIGLGIANLSGRAAPAYDVDFDRFLDAIEARQAQADWSRSEPREATGKAPSPSDPRPADAVAKSPERRRVAARQPVAPASGLLFETGRDVPEKTRLPMLTEIRRRLYDVGKDENRRVSREFLLMDRRSVLEKFGRPDSIHESQNGASEYWNYQVTEDSNIAFTIRGGYVISLH